MLSYLFKLLVLAIFSFIVIYFYYLSPAHVENFDGYLSYIILIGIFYSVYKYFQIEFGDNTKVKFSLIKIFGFFTFHLALLSFLFFAYNGNQLGGGISLFINIIFFLILPFILVVSSLGIGKKISSYLEFAKNDTEIFRFILSLSLGFFLFIFSLTILAIAGFYNLYSVFGLILVFAFFSYKELISIFSHIFSYEIEFDIKNPFCLKLLSTEFLFLISTLVISVSLISVLRPFPIGWDDLGAYMNYPNLLAQAEELIPLGGMLSWNVFTGIGYMFNSPTQAFFLNNVGGVLSFIVLVLITTDLLKTKYKTFLNIPMIVGTMFIIMPMVVFQQAKDMKVDPGLFFISISSLYILFKYYLHLDNETYIENIKSFALEKILHKNFNKNNLLIILIIGILAGFAFSIKFTSLLLISAIIGVIFYTRLGFLGLLGYLSIYFAIFTKANLWSMMNVVVNPNNITGFEDTFFMISFTLGWILFVFALIKNKEVIKNFFLELSVLIIGIIIALFPWLSKNIYESYPNLSVSKILSGTSERFDFDKSVLYSEEELAEIEEKISTTRGMSESGTTTNEDFGRYFGYEKGINNYIKLPWNLTMQKNQGGEFTDIGFLLLALIPAILLFLPYRKAAFVFIVPILLLELVIFLNIFPYLTQLFASLSLPYGYLFILLFFIIPVLFFIFALDDKKNKNIINLFKINLVFASFYTFLWTISAFGIVWYGITMYFSFLIMIAIGVYFLSRYKEGEDEKSLVIKMFGSIIFLVIFSIYIFGSVFPHSFTNLKNAGYSEFKLGQISSLEAPFLYQRDYLTILFHTNIDQDKKDEFLKEFLDELISKGVKDIDKMDITQIQAVLKELLKNDNFKIQAKKSLDKIYFNIVYPNDKYKSDIGIYRIGTFLKYYISENNKRLLEDSLIDNFNDYIYNPILDKTVENLKKLNIGYLLVDLNAATIDKDARHDLTSRYERLLSSFTSEKLELIETDSICLKIALEDYNKSDKLAGDLTRYMTIAGVNYESYKDGEQINRGTKLLECYNRVAEIINENKVDKDNYSYLLNIYNYISENQDSFKDPNNFYKLLQSQITHGYKALFKVK